MVVKDNSRQRQLTLWYNWDVNHRTKLYNFGNRGDPEYWGYYRIDLHSGSAAVDTPFVGSDIPNIDKTFAHGVRNSFSFG